MLLRFRVQNYRSFKAEQELSLVASTCKDLPEAVIETEGRDYGILRAAGIYGANASGKSNVLLALRYVRRVVTGSQRDWSPEGGVPCEPFLLDEKSRNSPSRFEVDFLLGDVRHEYGFSVNSEEVLEEWLFVYPKNGKRTKWFERRPGNEFTFGRALPGMNRTIEGLTRRNSLFLSAAAQNNHETLLPIYSWFGTELHFIHGDRTRWRHETVEMCTDEQTKNAVAQLVSAADLGIVGVSVAEQEMDAQKKKLITALRDLIKTEMSVEAVAELEIPEREMTLFFHHRGHQGSVPFDIGDESAGTVAFLALAGPVVRAIKSGGLLCVDELEASLHPLLAVELIALFNGQGRNPHGAQLIFNTHDTNLLNRSILRRDQIWFTEKDLEGATHLYPLSDFKPRKNENIEHGYLQGRYGAIPFIASTDVLTGRERTDASKLDSQEPETSSPSD